MSSVFPYDHTAILTGERLDLAEIQPDAVYGCIAVGANNWPGDFVVSVGFTREALVENIDKIAADLEEKLK